MKTHQHHGHKGTLTVGDHCILSPEASCDLTGNVTIEDYVTISKDVKIFTHKHKYESRELKKDTHKVNVVDLTICRNSFIGESAIILAVNRIGEGAIIGAGTVLTESVPNWEIWAGNPAIQVGKRYGSKENFPSVSWRCVTYKRLHFLEGLVKMFLDQDYLGKKELVILNDDPSVQIECRHEEVTVYNWKQRFANIREKVAKAVELCNHELIFPVADDDLYKPWTISTCVRLIGKDDFCAITGFIKQGGQSTQFHVKGVAGLYIIRKSLWDMVGGLPLYDPKSLRHGIKKRASDTAFFAMMKELDLYEERAVDSDQAFFTWRPALADKSMWKEFPGTHPDLFKPFEGKPEVFEIST